MRDLTPLPILRQVRPEAATPFERWMTCNGCGNRIQVCGAVSDLVGGVYRGVACGCRGPRVPWPESTFKQPGKRPSGAPDGMAVT